MSHAAWDLRAVAAPAERFAAPEDSTPYHLEPSAAGLTGARHYGLALGETQAYAWATVLLALSSVLLLAVALFGLGMCRVAARATESDALQIKEGLARAALAEDDAPQAQALGEQSWLDAEPRIRGAAGWS